MAQHYPPHCRGRRDWIDRLPADVRQRYERDVLGDPRTTAKGARQ